MTNQYKSAFDKYTCVGDWIETEPDGRGIYFRARIGFDHNSGPPDEHSDGFWPNTNPESAGYVLPENYQVESEKAHRVMQAWKDDEWFYCGIVISVHGEFAGCDITFNKHAASLWGIECNYPNSDNSYLTEVANELLGEAMDAADKLIDAIADKINQEE